MAITRNKLIQVIGAKYEDKDMTFAKQACHLLDEFLKVDENKHLAITYAANEIQANAIRKAQANGKFLEDLSISGGNQAAVFNKMIELVNNDNKYAILKHRIHVLPVATSLTGGSDALTSNQTQAYHAMRDLTYIAAHVNDDNYACYAIIDPYSQKNAIGGGNSKAWVTRNDTGKLVKGVIDGFIQSGTSTIYINCNLTFEKLKQQCADELTKYLDSWSPIKHHRGRAQAILQMILTATKLEDLKRIPDLNNNFIQQNSFSSEELSSKGLSSNQHRFFTETSKRKDKGGFDERVAEIKKLIATHEQKRNKNLDHSL